MGLARISAAAALLTAVLAPDAGVAQAAAPAARVLYSFTGGSDGGSPSAELVIDAAGALYGTAGAGGIYGGECFGGCGVAFKLTPPGPGGSAWTETVLHSFGQAGDGATPQTGLIAGRQGVFFGTTAYGGTSGYGTVFSLTAPTGSSTGWTEVVLYRFTGGPDGGVPSGTLVTDETGALYGLTSAGGSANSGVVFRLAPPTIGQTAWSESVLYSFEGSPDGAVPIGRLLPDRAGGFFGSTYLGGAANLGSVFHLSSNRGQAVQWQETVLHSFTGASDGSHPSAGVIAKGGGTLFGVTGDGGSAACPGGCGVLFELTPPRVSEHSWTETIIHRFQGSPDGSRPSAGLTVGARGTLVGTTFDGGIGAGTLFKLFPPIAYDPDWRQTILFRFTGGSGGSMPLASLLYEERCALYGTTYSGGGANAGTVFGFLP